MKAWIVAILFCSLVLIGLVWGGATAVDFFKVGVNTLNMSGVYAERALVGSLNFSDSSGLPGLKMNRSGAYVGNVKANDPVIDVCRYDGTNPEVYTQCDVVCGIEQECSVQPFLSGNYEIKFYGFGNEFYFDTDWSISSNTKIESGEGNTIFVISDGFSINPNGEDLRNIVINGINFTRVSPSTVSQKDVINFTKVNSARNLKFTNLRFTNINSTAIKIWLKNGATGTISGVRINEVDFIESLRGVSMKLETSETKDKIWNVEVSNINFLQDTYYSQYYQRIGNVLSINGGRVITLSNFNIKDAGDGPSISIKRSTAVDISNIYSTLQHDYTLEVIDGSQDVLISNIHTKDAGDYGALLIKNGNYAEETRNIKATGITCLFVRDCITVHNAKANSKIENVIIENFFINDTTDSGINIWPQSAPIGTITMRQGTIKNTDVAGIRFYYKNNANNVVVENMDFFNTGVGGVAVRRAAIDFEDPNVTNVNLRNFKIRNNTATVKYSIMFEADDASTQLQVAAREIDQGSLNYGFQGAYHDRTYLSNYQYTDFSKCETNDFSEGQIIHNATFAGVCVNGDWLTWTIT